MFEVGYEPESVILLIRGGLAIVLTGCVIKLMDDFLDLRYEVVEGRSGLVVSLGEGTLPYALLLLSFASMLHMFTAISLMLGAYAVGMAGEHTRPLPSGLKGYEEAFIVLILALVAIPWTHILWATCSMLAVQAIDDLFDMQSDQITGNPNLARKLGIVEVSIIGLLALIVAVHFRPVSTAIVFLAVPVVLMLDQKLAKPLSRRRRWNY